MSAHRFRAWVERLAGAGEAVQLSPDESHHVARVLRLRTGDAIDLFDGRGEEWSAQLLTVDRDRVVAELLAPKDQPVESPIEVHLVQACARPERVELAIQKATELGAASLSIWLSEAAEPAPRDKRLERWRRIVLEATKQSGRRSLPPLAVVSELPRLGPDELGLLCDELATSPLAGLAAGQPAAVRVAVGPAAGLTEADRSAAVDGGWQSVALGPRRLRSETAGIVAVALALHRWGDLGSD